MHTPLSFFTVSPDNTWLIFLRPDMAEEQDR